MFIGIPILIFTLLALIVILKFFAKKPHWALYVLTFLTFAYIDPLIAGFSPRTVLLLLLIVVDFIKQFSGDTHKSGQHFPIYSKEFRWIYAFIFLALFIDTIYSLAFYGLSTEGLSENVGNFFRKIISWLLIIFYFQKHINTPERLNVVSKILAISMTFPIFLAIGQFLGLHAAIDISLALNQDTDKLMKAISAKRFSGNITPFFRFGYYLIPMYFMVFYNLIRNRKEKTSFYLLLIALVFLGLIVNQTRSAIAGIALGTGYIFFVIGASYKKKLINQVLVYGSIAVLLAFSTGLTDRITSSERLNVIGNNDNNSILAQSISTRLDLFKPTLNLILHNPLGVGRSNFSKEILKFGLPADHENYNLVRKTSSHNQFLTIGGYYGIPSILIMLIMYIFIFKKLSRMNFYNNNMHLFRLCLMGWLIAYIFNGQVHNNYPYGAKEFAIFLGMFYALYNLYRKEQVSLSEDEE